MVRATSHFGRAADVTVSEVSDTQNIPADSYRIADSHVKADSHVPEKCIRPERKWSICYWRLLSMTVLLEEHQLRQERIKPWLYSLLVEDNTASECIRTVAATYGCKILQLYEYDANVYGYDVNCEWHPKNTSSCSIKGSWLPGWAISASV